MDKTWDEWLSSGGDEQFFSDLEKGLRWQFSVAVLLLKMQLTVYCDLTIDRRPFEERFMKHVASKDIHVAVRPGAAFSTVEAKSVTFPFGRSGRNHPFSTTFVGPVTHWRSKAENPPVATIIISQVTRHTFFVPTFTYPQWEVQTITDGRRNIPETNFAAPPSCWFPLDLLPSWLEGGVLDVGRIDDSRFSR